MKKLILTLAILICTFAASFAQTEKTQRDTARKYHPNEKEMRRNDSIRHLNQNQDTSRSRTNPPRTGSGTTTQQKNNSGNTNRTNSGSTPKSKMKAVPDTAKTNQPR